MFKSSKLFSFFIKEIHWSLDILNQNYSKITLSDLSKSLINKLLKKKVEGGVFLEEKSFFTKKPDTTSNQNFAQIITPICNNFFFPKNNEMNILSR